MLTEDAAALRPTLFCSRWGPLGAIPNQYRSKPARQGERVFFWTLKSHVCIAVHGPPRLRGPSRLPKGAAGHHRPVPRTAAFRTQSDRTGTAGTGECLLTVLTSVSYGPTTYRSSDLPVVLHSFLGINTAVKREATSQTSYFFLFCCCAVSAFWSRLELAACNHCPPL
jgi:hypothetical protein